MIRGEGLRRAPQREKTGRREQDTLWIMFHMIIVRWHDDHIYGKSDELYSVQVVEIPKMDREGS
jgi:hypothetical protein